ncbi:MAG: transcription antitermination factor NusB [bacterium]
MSSRHKARKLAVILLYQIECSVKKPEVVIREFFEGDENISDDERDYCRTLVHGYIKNMKKIDSLISEKAEKWQLKRIANYERNILRIGIYELLFRNDIPPKVAINEAINLAKELGSTDKSFAFINGIMDAVFKEIRIKETKKDMQD